ncbi:protein TOPAZ1 [Conger conger]|uniref:protein TOPAZ1 n=1 Tax=Conger conger TaxID=82655 RepID=UPI002A59EA4E|nr:protein TOPAZ1 [Conger conger]
MDSSPSQSEGSDFRDDAEHLRTSETNGSISETPESSGLLNGSSQSTQIMLELQHDGRSAEAVELQHDPTSCSPANGHPSEIVQEQGTCTEEIAETQLCESNCFSRQKLQQTKSPSKQSGSSVDQDERPTRTNPPTCSHLLNDTADSPTWERCAMPSGLAQVELSPCVSQAQSLEVNTALVHGWSVDDTSSMSSDDDLMDEVFAPCGEIMCEIRDVGRSCRSSAPDEVGPSGEAIDLLKAYEQDAIVLDVIQDDPELFGDVPEVPNVVPVMKSGIPSVSTFIHPMKMYTMKNNQKIIWDTAKLSATGRDNLGQQDDKKGVGRILLPVQIDGERPILNGQVGEGVHTESSVPAQSTAESAQSSEWLWPDFATSVQGNARLNSATAGAFTTDAGLDGDPMQTLVTNDLCAQSAVWTARSFSNQGEGSEKYCRYYFSEQHICFRKSCWYRHLPAEGDEKFCMAAVRRLCSGQPCHLHRAATVFTEYYQQCAPGVHFETHTLKSLLSALFSQGIVKDVLSVLRVMTYHQILPPVEFILSLFERVSVWGLQIAVSDLIDLTGKCVEAGLVLTTENFEYMQHRLELLQATSSQMEVFMTVKYRALETAVTWKPEVGHLPIALAEVECCKEQQDWSKLGALFSSMCTSKASLAELNHLSGSIAMALLMDTPLTSPFPFCQFLEAVCQGASLGGLVKSLLGRIGVSLMLRYYKTQQWTKGKKLLDALNALKVNYSTFKGLIAGESSVSRCRIISMAAEVFLSCGSMENALRVLKDNEWILRSLLWQCEEADIAHRQSVLCRLAECTTQKNMFTETLEILTNLPDLADVPDGTDAVDPSQYSIFHWHLKACLEKQNLIVGSNIVEVMFTKKIEVDVCLLRSLVHKLGKQNSWQKARSLYKSALSVGCYPQTQMNKYCRILPVPHSLSEIEMTLALEMFMVSNASDIQNPGFFPHALQIVLKGKGGTELVSETDHHAAISRLLSAAQTANPKLVIKYATVSVNKEQVFTLDSLSAYKWLSQNLNWASKVWLSSDSKPETDFSPQALST